MQKRGYKMVVLSISATSFSILILFSRCSSRIGAELAGLPLQRLGLDLPLGFEFLVWFGRVEHKSLKKSWCWGNSELRLPLDSFSHVPSRAQQKWRVRLMDSLQTVTLVTCEGGMTLYPSLNSLSLLVCRANFCSFLGQTMANPGEFRRPDFYM